VTQYNGYQKRIEGQTIDSQYNGYQKRIGQTIDSQYNGYQKRIEGQTIDSQYNGLYCESIVCPPIRF
jgi:DNA-directed RNA polymerase subunit N (RpoN/RPB10)